MLQPNQSLQLTLDPAGTLPGGRAPSASSAAEHRRYAALERLLELVSRMLRSDVSVSAAVDRR